LKNKKHKIAIANWILLILVILLVGPNTVFAQEPPVPTVQKETEVEKEVYESIEVDVKPEFPGGILEFYNFVGKNYRVPKIEKLNGKVIVEFIIEKDGSLSNFTILRELGAATGKEAIRVLKRSPKWIPGKIEGKAVSMKYTIPISIQGKL
jgi:hypothetical protein